MTIEDTFNSMDALLARYVAGTLPKPVEVLVASHLELSASSRLFVRALETAAGSMLENETPLEVAARDAMLKRIFASADNVAASARKLSTDAVLPRALHDFIGHSVDTIPWKTKMPGFREFDMPDVDGCHVSMMWIKPGRKMPSHTHEGVELTLVLDGAFTDTNGRFGRGDISIADDTIDHRPIADEGRACIAFAVTDGALRLTGPLHRRIGDILGTT